ncbi:unnamed protein product [Brassica rapa subsp. narinosa]
MSSSDAIVAQAAFDVLRLGRSAQFIVALLLRFWDSKNIKKHDVVGKIHFVQGSDLKDAQVMTRVVVCFVIEPTVVVYLSLWDEAAAMFRGLISSGDRTQTVMVVTTVNPKKFASLLYMLKMLFRWFCRLIIHEILIIFRFCRLRIVEVLKHNNWYYVSCTGCSRKLDKSDQSPHCNRCVNLNATGVVK